MLFVEHPLIHAYLFHLCHFWPSILSLTSYDLSNRKKLFIECDIFPI